MALGEPGSPKQVTIVEPPEAENPKPPTTPVKQASDNNWDSTATPKTMDSGDLRGLARAESFKSTPSLKSINPLHNQSIFARIASNKIFEYTTLTIIVINAVWIGVDTQINHDNFWEAQGEERPIYFFGVECVFVVYFTFEVGVRTLAFKNLLRFYKDRWFVFDAILVVLMLLEFVVAIVEITTGSKVQLPAFGILRLLRLVRLTRLMRGFPELMTIIRGMAAAARASVVIFVFLLGLVLVFGIIYVGELSDSRGPEWRACNPGRDRKPASELVCDDDMAEAVSLDGPFGGWTACEDCLYGFLTLWTQGVLGDNLNQACMFMWNAGPMYFYIFMVFCLLTNTTLLNMLIGVLCDVVTSAGEDEKSQTQQTNFRETLNAAFDILDKSRDGRIQKHEWHEIKENPSVLNAFEMLGLERSHIPEHMDQLEETLFPPEDAEEECSTKKGGLTMADFTKRILALRPEAKAQALDVEVLRVMVQKNTVEMRKHYKRIESSVNAMVDETPATGEKIRPPDADQYPPDWLAKVPHDQLLEALRMKQSRAAM